MTFSVQGDAYDRFMGRYSRELVPLLIDFAEIEPRMSAIDVGCGPGALTEELAERVGAQLVGACDPSESLVKSCAARVPGADVRRAEAEELPWSDEVFDTALAQLVVNFMRDARAGVGEMRRVTRRSGVVAACTWDYGGEMQLLRTFWNVARALDPDAPDEARTMRFIHSEELAGLWRDVGLSEIQTAELVVETTYSGFEDLWHSLTMGVCPAGHYCNTLDADRQEELRAALSVELGSPEGPFTMSALAWAVRGVR